MNQKTGFDECERISQIAQAYAPCCGTTFNEMCTLITKKQYGVGGECMHRGYYCPSKIFDVVTNAKRGRIVKMRPAAPEYVYGFDASDRLLIIETPYDREFIIRDGANELGITLNNRLNFIESITESAYDETGKIKTYSLYAYNGLKQSVIDFTREIYTYDAGQLVVDSYSFLNSKAKPILEHYRYCFSVKGGFLESYTCEKYQGGNRVPHVWDDRIFRVKQRRKI